MTVLIVVVIIAFGGAHLARLALRDDADVGTWASTDASPSPSSLRPPDRTKGTTPTTGSDTPAPTSTRSGPRRTSTSPGDTPTPTRGRQSPTVTPTPSRTKTPRVVVAGPTVDNIYPNDDGCHIFWIRATGFAATIADVGFRAGATPSPDPGSTAEANRMRAEYVACDATADGYPRAEAGCGTTVIVSDARGCGIRMKVDTPTRPGEYHGTLTFDLFVLCTDADPAPCGDITSPHPPTAERPVRAEWSMRCPMTLVVEIGRPQNATGACEPARR